MRLFKPKRHPRKKEEKPVRPDFKKADKLYRFFAREASPRAAMDEAVQRKALQAREFAYRNLKGNEKLKDTIEIKPADQTEFAKAVRLYHLERIAKGLKIIGSKKGGYPAEGGYELFSKPKSKGIKGLLERIQPINPFRLSVPGGKPGPLFVIIYPVVVGFRLLALPFSIPSRMAARFIKRRQVQSAIKAFGGIVKENQKKGKLTPVQGYVVRFKEIDKLSPDDRKKWVQAAAKLSEEEEKSEAKRLEELRKAKKRAA